MRLSVALVVVAGWCSSFVAAQSTEYPHSIDEYEGRANLLQEPEPVYPPIAIMANVQGEVVIAIVVDVKGQVASAKVLTGPLMLQQAALDAVRKLTFTPFEIQGAMVPVSTTIRIPFRLKKAGERPSPQQQKAAEEWLTLNAKCETALRRVSAKVDDSLRFCKEALEKSLEVGEITFSDRLARIHSHESYGAALGLSGEHQNALVEEDSAVEEAKKYLTEANPEYPYAFFRRAQAEAVLGQSDAACADLNLVEETLRKGITHQSGAEKKGANGVLAQVLSWHAAFLEKLGRNEEAAKLRNEAASM